MNPELASRYQQLMRRVAALAGGTGKVTMIAVSKTQPLESIESLYHLGHRDFGENYAQELIEKAEKLEAAGCVGIRWHFIGHLQSNKIKGILPYVHAIHSVDSLRLASELSKKWRQLHDRDDRRLPCFLEVNIDHESSKTGISPEDAPALAASIAETELALRLEGLMAIPGAEKSPEDAAKGFAALRELELKCRPSTSGRLSMGMSGDYEIALSEGATHVRIGTALFGARKTVSTQ